jgi:hypothetical protein
LRKNNKGNRISVLYASSCNKRKKLSRNDLLKRQKRGDRPKRQTSANVSYR